MSERLCAAFPGLRTTPFQVTSPIDPAYNCIAWAAGSTSDWWWPLDDARQVYWPPGGAREISIPAFVAACVTLRYTICPDEFLEVGFERIALFADSQGTPTHAARQLPTGRWTSKLGQSEDIEHELRALEGQVYGAAVVFLKRPTQAEKTG